MVDELLFLYTKDRFTRLLLYACILLFSLSYGVINGIVLNRSTEQVSREVLILTLILAVGLPTVYVLKRGRSSQENLDFQSHFGALPVATIKPDYEAVLFGSVALAERRHAFQHEELMNLRHQFSMEYDYRHEPGGLKSDEPFVIEHEYQIGRMLSVGVIGALLLSAIAQLFIIQSALSLSLWILTAIALAVSLGEFFFFRSIIAAFVGSTRKPSRVLSKIATGTSAAAVLLLLTVTLLRSVPHPFEAVIMPVLAMLGIALPFCAGSLSVAADALLWSHRFVALMGRKERELERLQYELHTLHRVQEQLQRTEDARKGASDVNTGNAPPYASLP